MGMLDDLLAQAGGNIDIAGLAGKAGLDPAMVEGALGQLLPQIADPAVNNAQAVAEVAGNTGLNAGALGALLPQLLQAVQGAGGQGGALGQVMAGLNGGGGAGGLLGQVGGMLDRDGDGNPINDIIGMFGKK
ncbi:hypothetical protein [Sandarakinorhabdus limnophila]|uniref:hypothetical protein n=1 Tax=Sandarakinorhabdus limnophila TaxID=210512 RepID=UPI0026EC070C|nr:hypothetical protein [Sandarakinorhabdus limnophila]MCM0031934.1 hypothetical protein [Sandarakinorhabdus limnophila]